MNPAQPYLELLQSERERLRTQGWFITPAGAYGAGRIRNKYEQCPICAFAALNGVDKYTGDWILALRELFGLDADYSDALNLILAADGMLDWDPAVAEMRAGLIELLDLRELCPAATPRSSSSRSSSSTPRTPGSPRSFPPSRALAFPPSLQPSK